MVILLIFGKNPVCEITALNNATNIGYKVVVHSKENQLFCTFLISFLFSVLPYHIVQYVAKLKDIPSSYIYYGETNCSQIIDPFRPSMGVLVDRWFCHICFCKFSGLPGENDILVANLIGNMWESKNVWFGNGSMINNNIAIELTIYFVF